MSDCPKRRPPPVRRAFPLFFAVAGVLQGCAEPSRVAQLDYELRRTLPHDPNAYTQGLLVRGGSFFESTGRLGQSELREVDVATGQVMRSLALDSAHFGEGLALMGDELVQLTWKAGIAFVYDAETFSVNRTFEYSGEGWGLCYDGESLYMSNGTSTVFRRSPSTFDVVEELRVTRDGFSVRDLNELECVGDNLWANIYMTDRIVRIDKRTGEVTGEVDAHRLSLASGRPADPGAVFNGIAYDETAGTFYVAGKLWPQIFEITIPGG